MENGVDVYKNRWTRTVKQNEKSKWVKPHKAYHITDDWCNIDES